MNVTEPGTADRTALPKLTRTMVQGSIGSILVVAGSLGIGWLASVSPLNRMPLLISLRTESWGVIASTAAMTIGCWIMFRAWLRLGQKLRGWPEGSLAAVRRACWAWGLPLLACVPIFSRDVFAYIGQGRLVEAGHDPYQQGISTISNWFQLGTDTMWSESTTPYGPLFLNVEHLVMMIAGDNPDLAIILFRLAAYAGVVLCMVYTPKLAALHGVSGAKATWITVANPLFLISFIASAHNDALMVGLAVAGTYFAATGRGIRGVLLITASIGIKPITMVLLPFIGLLWAGPGASWLRRFVYWAYTAAIGLGLMVVIGYVNGYGLGWLTVMLTTGTGYSVYSPIGILINFLHGTLGPLGLETSWVLPTLKLIGRLASVAIVLLLMFKGSHGHIVQRMVLAFAALVVLSPVIHPWYLLWLLPFFAASGIRDDWQTIWVYFTVAFFIAYGVADQLFVWQFLGDIKPLLQQLATFISWAFMAYLAFFDPKTRLIFVEFWKTLRLPRRFRFGKAG
ncbi:polyprenol phosphomannose-dependent alpha 1,6 mannosyltransferase MptB [Zhihengliuella salsuginis]|uniref:Membrane protein n=1 Tax=Zhihengliuella salsuginis TaxID=578222 RepID=A0ABQ3GE33_9MICC|nr:polyprenol phosphomannose-dependent alpha 1,6 mannosyltransferase MptB [Zhihengliuella salsuginis]GHD01739.1 membrane protein [Zhihengliuella salsuginis]